MVKKGKASVLRTAPSASTLMEQQSKGDRNVQTNQKLREQGKVHQYFPG